MRKGFARARRRMVKRLNAMRMGAKLRLFYILVCAIPCLAAGIFAVVSTGNLFFEQRSQAVQRKHAQTRVVFSNATMLCVNVSQNILFDENLRALLRLPPEEAERNLFTFTGIAELLRNYPALDAIEIYTTNSGLVSRGPFLAVDEGVADSEWYQTAAASKGTIRWYVLANERESQLCLVRKMPLGGGQFAVMVLRLSNDYLRLQISEGEFRTVLYLQGEPFYGSGDLPEASGGEAQMLFFCGTEMLACQSEVYVAQNEKQFAVVTADPNARADLWNLRLRFAGLLCLPMLAALLVVLVYSYRLGWRVTVLRNQMRSIAQGGTGISPQTVKGSDELAQLFWDMTRTVQILQDLNRQVYEKELVYQRLLSYQTEIEYKMLASQINPHFLFNTLESIRMKAVMNQDREVATIVYKLGQIMRRLLSASQSTVTLRSELDLVQDYLEIQQFRYGARIAYEIEADEAVDADHLYTLPLLLLPLVENAVIHGLDAKRGMGKIRVKARQEGDVLRLSVLDNGVGMEEAQRQALLRRMKTGTPKPDGKNIGLFNVDQRIRLCYGPDYGVSIQSKPGKGTRVDLRLPVLTEREA